MNFCPIDTYRKWTRELLCDDSGRPSLSKTILFYGFLAATGMCIKLIVLGGFSVEYFTAYLFFATGHAGVSKYLDVKADAKT